MNRLKHELAAAAPSGIHAWSPERDDIYFDSAWETAGGLESARVFCRASKTPYYYSDARPELTCEPTEFITEWHGTVDLPSGDHGYGVIGTPGAGWEAPELEAGVGVR